VKALLLSLLLVASAVVVSGCAVEVGSSPAELAAARHVSDDPPYVSVVTMVNNGSGRAAHSALIINGSERVIYDPAGTFQHQELAERGDIHYGATDRMVSYYMRYHARFSHFVHEQRLYVSPAVAEATLRRAQLQGPSPKMMCNFHTTDILNDVGAFGTLNASIFPEKLRQQFATIPGVQDHYTREDADRAKAVPNS